MNTVEMRTQVKQYIEQLSPESLQSAADFLAYLYAKESQELTQINDDNGEQNALQLAGDLVGCIDAPADLSTNKDYLKGLGK